MVMMDQKAVTLVDLGPMGRHHAGFRLLELVLENTNGDRSPVGLGSDSG